MGKFEDGLLDDLMGSHGAQLAAAARPASPAVSRRAAARVAAVTVVAAAVVAGITVTGSGTPAYAVTENPDGTVTVSISDVRAIGPANAALREHGVRAKAVPTTKDCAPLTPDRFGRSRFGTGPGEWSVTPRGNDAVTIAGHIPEGETALLTVSPYPGRGTGLGFVAPVRDPAPDCSLDPADDPELSAN